MHNKIDTNHLSFHMRSSVLMMTLIFVIFGCVPLGSSNNSADMSVAEGEEEMMSGETIAPINEGQIEGTCQDAADEDMQKDTVRIVYDFEKSVHEMVVCGGLTFALISALIDLIVELVVDPSSLRAPDAFTYDVETHSYTSPPSGFGQTTMSVQFFETDDSGEEMLITHDLFKASSYLTEIRAELNVGR